METTIISPRIAAVIVTYNRLDKLKSTLDSYICAGIDHLIIVNNASTDGTYEYLSSLSQLYPTVDITIENSADNLGGAGGFHHGLKMAKELKHIDWVVTSDDDSYPAKGALDEFKQQQQRYCEQNIGIVASAVFFPEGGLCPMNQPMGKLAVKQTVKNILNGKKITGVTTNFYCPKRDPIAILASSFVGMFIRKELLMSSGVLPKPEYFLYWDDIDFCLEFTKSTQAKIIFAPSVQYYHDCPRQSVTIDGERLYYMVRNGVRTILKLPLPLRFVALPMKLVTWMLRAYQTNSLHYYWKAIKDI